MAEIVLGFVVEEALSKLLSSITAEIKLAWGLDDELNSLRDSLAMVRDLLHDAEEQQMAQMAVRRWLKKLKVWAYDAEDLLDELAYEVLRRKMEKGNWEETKGQICLKFSDGIRFVQKTAFHVKMARKVKNVNELLDQIKNEASGFGLKSVISADRRSSLISWDRVTDSIIDHPVVAREAEVSKIVNLLAGSRDQQALTVVAIVGMGGIGKTTVAKIVCQKAMEKKLFNVKIWISVSTDFDEQKILGEMLQTLNKSVGGMTNKDATLQHLAEELEEKSFLLVLDDIWNREYERWNSLKSRLSSITKTSGNAVVVTSRSEEVALLMETSPQFRHKLNLLSNDECWSIIKERALGDSRASISSDLEAIGKEIASKCSGMPLAARVLGGTLHRNTRKDEWLSIKNSNVLNMSASEVSIESVLRLSFDRLPFHLKPCFAYCSIYPKSFIIWKAELIDHWMAHGLLDSSMEDAGEKYFNELLRSSFLLDVIYGELGNITGARMHDLVHELALSISRTDILTWENYSDGIDISHIRHLNIIPYGGRVAQVPVFPKDGANTLRTLFAASTDIFSDSWKFKSLRILRLSGSNVKALPASIGKLKHLRVLHVSCSPITTLPESITKLCNLQRLIISDCKSLEKLPRGLKNLLSLRSIIFSYEKQMPSGVGCLTNLQRLSYFVVGPDRGGKIQELEFLNEVKDQLIITNLELVRDEEEAKKANLLGKKKIEALVLVWTGERENSNYSDKGVLNGLQPFEDLKRLVIKNYLAEKFPSWLSTMKVTRFGGDCCTFNNLTLLRLEGCRRCEEVPMVGHLPLLEKLEIVGLENVRCIGDEMYGSNGESTSIGCRLFPSLKTFELRFMNSLVEWMVSTTSIVFPCLEKLHIVKCPKLRRIPIGHLSSLTMFSLVDCDEFSELLFDEGCPLTSLQSLHINGCGNFSSFPSVQGLISLRSLGVINCNKLTSLPRRLGLCSSLYLLIIDNCQELTFVPEDLHELPSLDNLIITSCPKVGNFTGDILRRLTQVKTLGLSCYYQDFSSIQDIPSLDRLTVIGEKDFTSLPDQLQSLTALKNLSILEVNGMEALPEWLGNLSSLESINIKSLRNLKHLPSATALQGLTKLRQLTIQGCPFLKKSYMNRSGSEWCKISHIPNIIIDGEVIKASQN